MNLDLNEGDRPSLLQLGRFSTGELSIEEAAEIEAFITTSPEAQAHLAAVEAARSDVPAFDMAALRERSTELDRPTAANNNRGFMALVSVLLMAAVALLFAVPLLSSDPVDGIDPSYVGLRGQGLLELYHLEPEGLSRYDERSLGEGDVLGFRVDPAKHVGVVILSVDGLGQVSVYYPESGNSPEPVRGSGMVSLPGTVVLDGAPGPEVFIAVFDSPVDIARADVERAWQAGGVQGLSDWARSGSDIDLAVVNRK